MIPNFQGSNALSREMEVARLQARIAELEQEKLDVEAFAAVAAHELLAPVVMMDVYATMVAERLDRVLDVQSRSDLDALRGGAARSRLLVETLLHHARTREADLAQGPVDVATVVRECLALLAPEIHARHADVEVGALPQVRGETPLIGCLFSNLIVNALKYGPRERPRVQVGATREGPAWRFFVQSPGPVIPPEDRERIFEPYQRGRGERRVRGAGLGLSICRSIVERHGGCIGVEPVEGGENRFFFTLPD
jgi:signal transduction histidine kinase